MQNTKRPTQGDNLSRASYSHLLLLMAVLIAILFSGAAHAQFYECTGMGAVPHKTHDWPDDECVDTYNSHFAIERTGGVCASGEAGTTNCPDCKTCCNGVEVETRFCDCGGKTGSDKIECMTSATSALLACFQGCEGFSPPGHCGPNESGDYIGSLRFPEILREGAHRFGRSYIAQLGDQDGAGAEEGR